ncbi:hypothetical protein F2Q70_00033881 [Brassica cretica]|uniref:Peptidase A1 domain-containing protein n=1 Tax=Brassica cretica TaxID=69181 RepID=A0A8S9JSS5_BRACR|nr:hypothetical protein F2Q70_00033881 [Brassica cretica]
MSAFFFKSTLFLIPVLTLLLTSPSCSKARIFTFEMHHRFSDEVKRWSDLTGRFGSAFPPKGTFEYFNALVLRDRLIRGRFFSVINLHYTTVKLGTPGMRFMVALDTGSDLFWVPCDCGKCAPTEGPAYSSEFELSIYNPKLSKTNKKVTCNNSLCAQRNQCLGTFSTCPYMVSYVSAQTSTSGVLMEDVMHLTTEDKSPERVEAYVTFGCGQVQSGSFLDIAAPNGLFGLGMEKISVPSVLAREGLVADSFSMCFGHDGVGRISFGDKGSSDQEETPFNLNPSHPNYNITVTREPTIHTSLNGDTTTVFSSSPLAPPATVLSLNSGAGFEFLDNQDPLATSNLHSHNHLTDVPSFNTSLEDFTCFGKKRGQESNEGSGNRRHKRMIKNRESAARSRARKQEWFDYHLQAYTNELELEVAHLQAENAKLRRQQDQLKMAAANQQPKKKTLQRSSTSPF